MDQQQITIIAVVAIIAFLGLLFFLALAGAFIYSLRKRRANPRVRDVPGKKKQPPNVEASQPTDECGQRPGPQCVPARRLTEFSEPVAIYGVATDGCCGGKQNAITQRQLQELVDLANQAENEKATDEMIERISAVLTRSRSRSNPKGDKENEPIQGNVVR